MSALVRSVDKPATLARGAAKTFLLSGADAMEAVANDSYSRRIIQSERAHFLSKTVLDPRLIALLAGGLPLALGCVLGAVAGPFGWSHVFFVLAMSSILTGLTLTFSSQRIVVTDQALYAQRIVRPLRILVTDIEEVETEGVGRVRIRYRTRGCASKSFSLADAEGLAEALTSSQPRLQAERLR
jgi:hypothetical protein